MHGHTVLVVDDEAFILDEMREAFEDEGWRVVTAPSGEAALALPEDTRIDLLVTDLKMPGLNGIALYRRLCERPGVAAPAILLSGHGARSNEVEALEAGFAQCLAKPVDLDALLDTAARLCADDSGLRED